MVEIRVTRLEEKLSHQQILSYLKSCGVMCYRMQFNLEMSSVLEPLWLSHL